MENQHLAPGCLNAQIPSTMLEAVCAKIEGNNYEITDDDIAVLYNIFGKKLLKSFEMIDKGCFELVTVAKSNRFYIVVHGTSGIYTLYPFVNFCQCLSYKFNVINKKNFICKHILGSKLAMSMKKCNKRTSTDFIYHNMSDNALLIEN